MEVERSREESVFLKRSGLNARKLTSFPGNTVDTVWIVILGFMGATEKNLRKFVAAYVSAMPQQRSYKILCAIAPITHVLKQGMELKKENFDEGPYSSMALDLIDVINKENKDSKIILHVMSQNGAFAYRALLSCNDDFRRRVIGTVFDSSPVKLSVEAVGTAVKQAVGSFFGSSLISVLRYLVGGRKEYARRLQLQDEIYTEWFMSEAASRLDSHYCFLYSSSDKITSAIHVERIIDNLRKLQRHVQCHNFHGAGHVANLSLYPREYMDQLAIFIEQCLSFEADTTKKPCSRFGLSRL
jgi:hypothetical protein